LWQDNAGEAKARETGTLAASTDVVVLLDDDVVAAPGLVAGHLRHHEAATGRVVVGYMPTVVSAVKTPGRATTVLYQQDYEKICREYEKDSARILQFLWAGNTSMRRADALAVGFPTDVYLGYHADQLFGLRCADAGLHAVFDRSLVATHKHVRSFAAFAKECYLQGEAEVELTIRYPGLADATPRNGLENLARFVFRQRGLCRALTKGLVPLGELAGRLRWWSGELLFARILRQVAIGLGSQERRAALPSAG
jgi:hypothetical protein